MNDSDELHWSFNYNQSMQKPSFAQQLVKTLDRCYAALDGNSLKAEESVTHVYDILPNFWRGYRKADDVPDDLSIGKAVIKRQRGEDNIWIYSVQHTNTTSGEELQLEFSCVDDLYRSLTGRWKIRAQNGCTDAYSAFACDGRLASQADSKMAIRLEINQTEIAVGVLAASMPLTCNWALFDGIAAIGRTIQKSGEAMEVAVLEDLEKLRPQNRLGFLESIDIIGAKFDGYYLHGEGVLPSYWWLDEHDNAAIVSSLFQTLVLKEILRDTP